mgnify:CR=1 FL=1
MRGLRLFRPLLVAFLSASLAGCSQGTGYRDLDEFMEEARNQPQGRIEPLPEFEAYEAFSYSASGQRSPFTPPADVVLDDEDDEEDEVSSDISPDENRPKEPLERYSIGDLTMVGTIQRAGEGSLYALIRDNQGGIHRVTVGDHMGQNYGRVQRVSEMRIELREIVSDGSSGWVRRPRTVTLASSEQDK